MIDLSLALNVQRAGGLIQQQHLGLPVDSARDQDALPLPARQGRAHIANQRVVAHRHGLDVVVHGRYARALLDPLQLGLRVEERDVVVDRPGQEALVLHHNTGRFAPRRKSEPGQGHAADEHFAAGRRLYAQHDLQQRALAAARRAHDGHRLTGLDAQVDAAEHIGLAIAVAKTHIAQLDAQSRRSLVQGLPLRHSRLAFRRGEHDIGQSLTLEPKQGQVRALVDQAADAQCELLFVGNECEEHAHRQVSLQHEQGAQPDHGDTLQPEQQAVQHREHHLDLARRQLGVHGVHGEAAKACTTLALRVELLDRLDAAQRLKKVAVLA